MGLLYTWRMLALSPKLVVTIGVLFTSLSSTFVRSSTAPAIAIAMYRMWFSVILLLPFLIVEKVRNGSSNTAETPRWFDYVLCVLSGVFLALHFWSWFASLRLTTIASATVLVDTHPIFVLILGFFVLKERVTKKAIAFVGVTLVGMAVLSFGDLAQGADTFAGDMLALGGAATVSGYMLIGRIVRQRMTAFAYVVMVYFVAAVTLTCIAIASGVPLFGYEPREYLIFVAIAFFCTLLGHTLFNWALKYLKTSYISMIVLTEPVYATILGIIIFSEIPGVTTYIGGAVVLLGVFLFVKEESKLQNNNAFDEKAKEWDANPIRSARNEAVAKAIRRTIPLSKDTRALDFGAGTGLLSLELAPDVGSILAVDTSDGMLTELTKKLADGYAPHVAVLKHDLVDKQLTEGPFDLIFTVLTLHHVEDTDTLLDRFAELLAEGGYLAIAELAAEDGSFHGEGGHAHHRGFDPDDLAARLESRGIGSTVHEEVFLVERDSGTFPVFLLTGRRG